jgi:hypothetical protein
MVIQSAYFRHALRMAASGGSVANSLFDVKKLEFSIISKTRFVFFAGFFWSVGE